MLDIVKKVKAEKLLFLDIETRAQVEKLEEETPLFDLVEYTVSRRDDFEDNQQIHDYYNSKAALMPEWGAVNTISVGFVSGGVIRVTSFYGENEQEILEEFVAFLNEMNVKFDAIGGFATNDFDIPFLIIRMLANDITDVPRLLDESTEKPWTCKNFDLKQAVKLGRPRSPSLLGLCTVLGVDSPKQGISGKDVSQAFFDGRIEEIKDYCERDVTATVNCLLRLQGKEVLPQVSVKLEKSYKEKGYKSELDKLLATGDVDMEGLAKEGAKLNKKEQELYLKLTETLAK